MCEIRKKRFFMTKYLCAFILAVVCFSCTSGVRGDFDFAAYSKAKTPFDAIEQK